MMEDEILGQVQGVIREELDNQDIIITKSTTANQVDDWDSLANIQIIVALEKKFGVKFTALQINNFKNVGEICECIQLAKS